MIPASRTFRRGDLAVHWLEGALLVQQGDVGLLLDCPLVAPMLLADQLHLVHAVMLTSGRDQAIGGLLSLLSRLRRRRIDVAYCADEERIPILVGAFQEGWPNSVRIRLDGVVPGESVAIGPLQIHTHRLWRGEPDWLDDDVTPSPGVAVRVETGAGTVAWIPGAAPSRSLKRIARADLAVVEVGVRPWPDTPQPWRLTVDQAVAIGTEASELWLVGDDGRLLSGADA